MRRSGKKGLVEAIDEVAAALGNTRAICRKYYIHPAVSDAYLGGTRGKGIARASRGSRRRTGLFCRMPA